MPTPVNITDQGTGETAKIVVGGALAVLPPQTSTAFNALLDVDDTPVTIVSGQGSKVFCITAIMLTGNKDISTTTDATVTIYRATADDLTVNLESIFIIPIARSSQSVLSNILVEVPEGNYIMGTTSDDDVFVTILGWYV